MKRLAVLSILFLVLLTAACSGGAGEDVEEGISGTPPLSSSTFCGEAGKRQPCKVQLVELKVVPLSAASARPPKEVKKLAGEGADILKAVIRITNEGRGNLPYRSDWYLAEPPGRSAGGIVPDGVPSSSKIYRKKTAPIWIRHQEPRQKGVRGTIPPVGTVTETVYFYPVRQDYDRVVLASSWFRPGFTANVSLVGSDKGSRTVSSKEQSAEKATPKRAPLPQVRVTARATPARATNGSDVNLVITVRNVGTLPVKDLVIRFAEMQNAFPLVAATPTEVETKREESVTKVDPKPTRISSYGANYHFGELPGGSSKVIKLVVTRWVASVTQMQEARTAGNVVVAMDRTTALRAAGVQVTLEPEKF